MKLKISFLILCALGAVFLLRANDDGAPHPVDKKVNAAGQIEYEDYPEKALAQIVITTKQVVNDYQCIPSPGNPPTGNVRVYCDSSTGLLVCKTSAGASCSSNGAAAGSNTQVQFNDAGVFGGDAGLTYNKITKALSVQGDAYLKSGRPWIDVVAYGADPAGVADSTSAFQSAFTAWKAFPSAGNAGTIYIPSGIYLITTSIDATGVTYGGTVRGAGISSNINCQLSAANPCLDFTGSQYVAVRDLQITGVGAGSQSAAILNARSQSNTRGDFPLIENVFISGTFSKAAFANISADQGTYFRDILSPASVPVGLFLGCSDVLGVTSAYATFASTQGCTYYHIADSSFNITTPTTTANISTISQSTTTLTITVPATSPVAVGQTFTLSGTLSTTANTLTVLTSTQGVISGTTSGAHGLVVGDRVVIAGVTPAGLNKTCTIATVPSGTTFTCNAGNGLADLVGTVFGTVTRTWDEDYVAATVSGSTITTTMATTVTDTGSAAGTIEISGEGIRAQGVGAFQVDNTYFGFAGNGTAAIRISGNTSTNIKMYNTRVENNSFLPLTHVVDSYSSGIGAPDINGRFNNVLGSVFRVGVGQTISKGRFLIFGSDSTELLFDGGGNVSQVNVTDISVTSYSFNIGSGSAQNYFLHPTGKNKQFVGTNSTVVDGNAIWENTNNLSLCLYDTEICPNTGRVNMPNNKYIYEKNAAGNADIALVGLDASNILHLNSGGSNNVYVDAGQFGFTSDNAEDIGINGNHRPRTVYVGTSIGLAEASPPSGLATVALLTDNSTDHTVHFNANNNGDRSPSGAWSCTNVTPVTLPGTSTTADQNLMACTIPAGTLNRVGRTLRVKAKGVYSTAAASVSQITIKLELCTVSGCGSGTVITPINIQSTALGTVQITNDNFSLRSEITTQTAGASSAYEASGEFLIDLSTLTTAADSEFGDTNTATVGTIDSTAQLFLQTTIAFSVASASNVATQRQLIAETVN